MKSLSHVKTLFETCFQYSSSTTFQVLSDLHLEVSQQYTTYDFPAVSPYLILAGDIGRLIDYADYRTFLHKQTSRFELVFWVLGNHEFYGSTHEGGLELAVRLEKDDLLQSKLVLLHRKRIDVPNTSITILGCTLWSRISEDAEGVVRMKVNDFNRIDGWTTKSHNGQHSADIRWLRDAVSNVQSEGPGAQDGSQDRKILIVTHHAPCVRGTSEPRFDTSPWASAFSTELLEDKLMWKRVDTWVYGHTHYSTQLKKAGIKVVSNQRGYVFPDTETNYPEGYGKGKWRKFDEAFVVRL